MAAKATTVDPRAAERADRSPAPPRLARPHRAPQDIHAILVKYVLVPSLALTSIGGVTPANSKITSSDENLLQGAQSIEPVPEVVGITVHLTFAKRAYELAAWFRAHGSIVIGRVSFVDAALA